MAPNVGETAVTPPNGGADAGAPPGGRDDAVRCERHWRAVPTQRRDGATWKCGALRAPPDGDDGAVGDCIADSLHAAKRFGVGVARP